MLDFDDVPRIPRSSSLPAGEFFRPSDLRGTPLARQGYLPDLEPLLTPSRKKRTAGLGQSLLPRSNSSPQMSPSLDKSPFPTDMHHDRAGVCLTASPKLGAKKMTTDGLWGTICSMCSATLGAGALSLPYAFKNLGLGFGLIALVVTAAASNYSVVLLTSAIARTGTRSYEELTVLLFGKAMGVIVELNIIVFCFGSSVAYTVAVGDLLHPLTATWLSRKATITMFWLFVLLPLSFASRLEALQCASVFGVLAVVYLALSVVAHALLCRFASGGLTGVTFADITLDVETTQVVTPEVAVAQWWTWSTASFEALAVMMFAFTCQVNVPSLYDELHERSLPRMRAVSARSIGICLLCYSLVGVAGYADAPASTSGNLLNNYCVQPMSKDGRFTPSLMLPAYAAMAVSVLMAYPLNICARAHLSQFSMVVDPRRPAPPAHAHLLWHCPDAGCSPWRVSGSAVPLHARRDVLPAVWRTQVATAPLLMDAVCCRRGLGLCAIRACHQHRLPADGIDLLRPCVLRLARGFWTQVAIAGGARPNGHARVRRTPRRRCCPRRRCDLGYCRRPRGGRWTPQEQR